MGPREVQEEYFQWLCDIVRAYDHKGSNSYSKLLRTLHRIAFVYSIPMDENRYLDGLDMRDRFADDIDAVYILECLDGECSILEMMVALAVKCEEEIMDNARIGDRTAQWFWQMITNLGLGDMYESRFDSGVVQEAIDDFLSHNYAKNGKGGLFRVRHSDEDLRKMQIWNQMLLYLNEIPE